MATENNQTPPQVEHNEPDDLDLDLSQLDERKTNSRKAISILAGLSIILLLVIAVPLFLKFIVFAPKEEQGTPIAKDEALQGTQQEDNSIAAMQKRMEQDKQQRAKLLAQQLADQERQKADLERRRQEALERKRQLEEAMRNQQTAEQQGQQNANRGRQNDQPMSPSERKLTGQVMVNLGGEDKAAKAENASNNSLNTMLESEEFASSAAGMQTIDPRYLLIRGSQIPCVLKTKLVTDYQGPVMCVVDKDIYSDDVSNLLIRRGSTVHGQQTRVITQGASRVFINWGSIDTPEHVRITVNALGTDTLGAAGAPAWMDTHFWDRFGNTLKLMTFSDALETGKNALSQSKGTNNGYISYDNTTDGVQDLANTALKRDIDIPDTGYINQGTLMNIYVPRDLDFSTVFHDQ